MRTRRKSSPSSPEAAALRRAQMRLDAADPARWGVEPRGLCLMANQDVEAELGGNGAVVRARRQDLWDRLHARGALSDRALAAVRRFESDLTALHRTGLGVRDFTPCVDGRGEPGAFGEARLRAGRRLRAALDLAGPASADLLCAICESGAVLGQALDWRAVVVARTGERLADAQGATLRVAAENLAGAYQIIDRGRISSA